MKEAILAVLLVACSGGGGSSDFVPTADVRTTHPWLVGGLGSWRGEFHSETAGLTYPINVYFWAVPTASGSDCRSQSLWGDDGAVRADGNRVLVDVVSEALSTRTLLDLRAETGGETMSGTVLSRRTDTGEVRERGTLWLQRTGPRTASIEAYSAPGWVIVVHEER